LCFFTNTLENLDMANLWRQCVDKLAESKTHDFPVHAMKAYGKVDLTKLSAIVSALNVGD